MAANVRTTVGGIGGKFPSRTPGDITGLSLNTFGMDKIIDGINGEHLAEILVDAIQPAYEQGQVEWPKDTWASVESMEVVVGEVGPKMARVYLQVGGQKLIDDPRNKKHIDYAPFIEFNGTATTAPGTLTHAMYANMDEMKEMIRQSVREYIKDLLV